MDDSGCRTAVHCEPLCEQGRGGACAKLAAMYELGLGVEPDAVKSMELLERACELGDLHACANAARPYRQGRGDLPKDLARAELLLRKSCDGGLEYGCEKLQEFKSQGP